MTKPLIIIYTSALIILSSAGCSINPQYPDYLHETRLEVGGYGYEVGDIILIDTQRKPALGDIVQYNVDLNNSRGRAMGPNLFLAKIIALPGDNVSFQQWSYEANGFEVTLGPYYKADGTQWGQTKQVMWGTQMFDDVTNIKLKVPEDEFLSDKRVGEEFSGRIDETGSRKVYYRFTVKKEAITGVILEKLGHDKEFEERQKHIVY